MNTDKVFLTEMIQLYRPVFFVFILLSNIFHIFDFIYIFKFNSNSKEGIKITLFGSCGNSVKWEWEKDTQTLTIKRTNKNSSGVMWMYPSEADRPWYTFDIHRLTIASGITAISRFAFYKIQNLSEVELPDSLTLIDDYAFSHCPALKSIIIPKNVETIGKYAFANCDALETVQIPKDCEIKEGAFEECPNLLI